MNPIRTIATLSLAALLCTATTLARADEASEINQLLQAGKTDEATTRLEQFLLQKPKDPQLRFLNGVMLADARRTDDAMAVFKQLNIDYPELPEPYNNLAVLYAGQGQYDQARAALEAAVRGNPNYATAYENLGDVYARLAMQAYVRSLALAGTNAALPPKIALLRTLFTPKPAKAKAP